MHAFAAAGGSFLLAVLWFDLMFDVQVRTHKEPELPPQVLFSIAAYYRRVTTGARPMNRLVGLVMLATLLVVGAEIVMDRGARIGGWLSLACAGGAIGLALARTVRNAVKLAAAEGAPAFRSRLARGIYRDHVYCFVSMAALVALQLAAV